MAAPEPEAAEQLSPEVVRQHEPALVSLLRNVVDDGASIGFLRLLAADEAARYWQSVAAAMREKRRVLWITRGSGGTVTGSVQLDLEPRPDGSHRAEIMKLMVLTSARRRGLGRALMRAAEEGARRLGRELDVEAGALMDVLILSPRESDRRHRSVHLDASRRSDHDEVEILRMVGTAAVERRAPPVKTALMP